jgi:hypothetical protein
MLIAVQEAPGDLELVPLFAGAKVPSMKASLPSS